MTDNKTSLAREWYSLQEKLKELKKQESALRKELMEAFFDENKSGTQKKSLSENANLVVTRSKSIKINLDKFKEKYAELKSKGLIGDDKLVKLEPKVSVTAYKHLSDNDKIAFEEVFEHTIGSPQMKVEVKKDM